MRTIFESPLNQRIEKIDIDETRLTSMIVKLKNRSSYDLLLHRLDLYSTVAGLEGSQEKEFANSGNISELTVTFEGNISQAITFLQAEKFVTQNAWWLTQALCEAGAQGVLTRIPPEPEHLSDGRLAVIAP